MLIKCKISLTALRVKYKIERGYFPMVKRDFVKYNRSLRTQQSFGDVMFRESFLCANSYKFFIKDRQKFNFWHKVA